MHLFKKSLAALVFSSLTLMSAQADTLRVGTESSYAPFEFTENGELVGFDVDLMNAIARELNSEVEWVSMSFDGLIPALLTNQLDLAVASFTITPERAKRINFSDPYYRSGLTFVIRKADQDKYKSAEDLKGQRLCAQLGSVSAAKAETFSPSLVTTFSDAPAAYMELKTGGCEAVLNDRPVNQYFFKTAKVSDSLVELSDVLDAEDMAVVIPKNNQELLEQVNQALAKLKQNGTYQKIYDKWFAE